MSYLHSGMPPVVRITGDNADGTVDWQLESQQGDVVQTYTTAGVTSPDDWWDDLVGALLATESMPEVAHDMIRLNAMGDWDVIDDS